MINIIVIAIAATLSGADGFVDIEAWEKSNREWLLKFLELKNGIPSHDTFGRVFSLIKGSEFQKAFRDWVKSIKNNNTEKEIYAIDGKFLRGSISKDGSSRSAIILVNAWATRSGLSVAQLTSKLKKNEAEKSKMSEILDCLDVKGNIFTFDAGGATTTIFHKVCNAGGDAIIGLKRNQKRLLKMTEHLFELEQNNKNIEKKVTEEKSHGRFEKRTYEFLSLANCNSNGMKQSLKKQQEKWEYFNGIVRIKTERAQNMDGIIKKETRYYFTSISENIDEIAEGIRNHWHVENKLHWQLDVTFYEDQMRARTGYAAENMGVLRQMAINLFKNVDSKTSMRLKRKLCGWDQEYLIKILFGINDF